MRTKCEYFRIELRNCTCLERCQRSAKKYYLILCVHLVEILVQWNQTNKCIKAVNIAKVLLFILLKFGFGQLCFITLLL